MFFAEPMVMHSVLDNGRHWLTTLDFPPMQILPAAPNHCRAGQFLARVIAMKLANESAMPDELTLTRADVVDREPELAGESGEVRVRFEMQAAPPDSDFLDADDDDADAEDDADDEVEGYSDGYEDDDEDDEDDGPVMFVTPLPPLDWTGDYDAWIQSAARRLGLDAPAARDASGYEAEMAEAAVEMQRRLPGLRARFADLGDLKMGLKIGIPTRSGGQEFVWTMPLEWPAGGPIAVQLKSEPRDCEGFELDQTLRIEEREVMDYAIGSETTGVIDPGLTERIAGNYGRLIS